MKAFPYLYMETLARNVPTQSALNVHLSTPAGADQALASRCLWSHRRCTQGPSVGIRSPLECTRPQVRGFVCTCCSVAAHLAEDITMLI